MSSRTKAGRFCIRSGSRSRWRSEPRSSWRRSARSISSLPEGVLRRPDSVNIRPFDAGDAARQPQHSRAGPRPPLSRFRRDRLRPSILRAPEAEALLRATQLCLIGAPGSLREIVMSAERLRADVFRLRRRKFAWAVPLLLVLAVLLVAALAFNLANLDTGGESIPQATAPGGPASRAGVFVPDPIATILLTVLSAFFLVGSVLLLLRNRSSAKRPPKAFSWWALLARALGMTLLIALLVGWPKAIQAARERVGTQANATAADTGGFPTVWPTAAGGPVELFLIAAVLAALAWLVFLLRRSRRQDPEQETELPIPVERQAAVVAVRSTIRDLEEGGDVRTAILACF